MSKSLNETRKFMRNMLRIGFKETEMDRKLIEHGECCSQGDFKPRYEKPFNRIYFSGSNINLSTENLKRLKTIAKRRGLQLSYEERYDVATFSYKERFTHKEMITISGGGKRIIVDHADYVSDSQTGLLEEIGSVFGMKA